MDRNGMGGSSRQFENGVERMGQAGLQGAAYLRSDWNKAKRTQNQGREARQEHDDAISTRSTIATGQ